MMVTPSLAFAQNPFAIGNSGDPFAVGAGVEVRHPIVMSPFKYVLIVIGQVPMVVAVV